jgi:hypothetical protein
VRASASETVICDIIARSANAPGRLAHSLTPNSKMRRVCRSKLDLVSVSHHVYAGATFAPYTPPFARLVRPIYTHPRSILDLFVFVARLYLTSRASSISISISTALHPRFDCASLSPLTSTSISILHPHFKARQGKETSRALRSVAPACRDMPCRDTP